MTTGADHRQRRSERQIRLADIGPGGQAKLCAAKVAIRSQGFARTIERRYVVRAGMTESAAESRSIALLTMFAGIVSTEDPAGLVTLPVNAPTWML